MRQGGEGWGVGGRAKSSDPCAFVGRLEQILVSLSPRAKNADLAHFDVSRQDLHALDQGETIGCVPEIPDRSYITRCEACESTNAQGIHLPRRTGGTTVLAYPAFVLE